MLTRRVLLLAIALQAAPAFSADAPADAPPASTEERFAELTRLREARRAAPKPRVPGRIERLFARIERATLPDRKLVAAFGVPVRRLRPSIGGQGMGSGFTVGLTYEWLRQWNSQLDLQAQAMYSVNKYQTYRLRAALPRLLDRRLGISAEYRYRYRPMDRFFGFGSESQASDETNYRLTDSGGDLAVTFSPARAGWLRLGGRLSYLDPEIGPGKDTAVPSIEQVFDPAEIPGLAEQAAYLRAEVSLAVDRRDQGYARSGGLYRVSFIRFDDRELDRFDFHRTEIEVQQYLPIRRGYRTLALRLLTNLDAERDGHQVPFYLQHTLGSSDDLRGLANFRFRDDSRLLLSAEYRWRLATPVDAALFVDGGKVFEQRDDFGTHEMNVAYGIGLRLHNDNRVLFRVDLAHSSEDTVVYFKLSHAF